jgi:hypothetical protein
MIREELLERKQRLLAEVAEIDDLLGIKVKRKYTRSKKVQEHCKDMRDKKKILNTPTVFPVE